MKVALLGGSFNPPHLAHERLARFVLNEKGFDQVWILPCAQHAFGKELAPFEDRIEMCRKAFSESKILVKEDEKNLSGYSFDLVSKLKSEYDHDFFWVGGEDLKEELHLWHRIDELKEMIQFSFLGRSESDFGNESSSEIRDLVSKGKDASKMLKPEILDYIQKKALYK